MGVYHHQAGARLTDEAYKRADVFALGLVFFYALAGGLSGGSWSSVFGPLNGAFLMDCTKTLRHTLTQQHCSGGSGERCRVQRLWASQRGIGHAGRA